MKKTLLILFVFSITLLSQNVYSSKWGFGGGLTYPRFMSVTGHGHSEDGNFGGYLSIEKSFSAYLSLRISGDFRRMESIWNDEEENYQFHKVNSFSLNLDMLYRFLPCEEVSPYVLIGIGPTAFKSINPKTKTNEKYNFGYQMNLGIGFEFPLSKSFSLKPEMEYVTSSDNKIDGNNSLDENDKGLFGGNGDTYMTFNAGLVWYFGFGEKSDICDKCPGGITNNYDIVFNPPQEKVKTDTVKIRNPFSVHFKFDKDSLDLEQYPALDRVVEILKSDTTLGVSLVGGADYRGTDKYNVELSKRRAEFVKEYLLSKGISKSRIEMNWKGETEPIKGDKTDVGNAYDRYVKINWDEK